MVRKIPAKSIGKVVIYDPLLFSGNEVGTRLDPEIILFYLYKTDVRLKLHLYKTYTGQHTKIYNYDYLTLMTLWSSGLTLATISIIENRTLHLYKKTIKENWESKKLKL